MIIEAFLKAILHRPFFRGQHRLFYFAFSKKLLGKTKQMVNPLQGNYLILCDPTTLIGASIIYMGDYEPEIKSVFRRLIRPGHTVLDIGANMGHHTLYFAELTGVAGQVISLEPVAQNYNQLLYNIALNHYTHVQSKQIALGIKNETIFIQTNAESQNPGAFNLFDKGGDTQVECRIGDELFENTPINFIKIDVEGYEGFVFHGLLKTIQKYRPAIVFEFDLNYHRKTNLPDFYIFELLQPLHYNFYSIHRNGTQPIRDFSEISTDNILALPV